MAKATITIEDGNGKLNMKLEFDRPVNMASKEGFKAMTPAQQAACIALDFLRYKASGETAANDDEA